MRRKTSFLTTLVLAATTVALPTAAYADATDARLTYTFDRLAQDRVVKLSLTATSASGITGVRANIRHLRPDAPAYATVEFTRVAGTAHDGVWEAEFRPDVQAHPGSNTVEVLISSANGARTRRTIEFLDCYETTITGFTAAPEALDFDHQELVMRGRVLLQRHRGVAPEPVPDVTVRGLERSDSTTTDPSGAFALKTVGTPYAHATVYPQGTLCMADAGTDITVRRQATTVSAQMTPKGPVAPGTRMTVRGKVVRHTDAGAAPKPGVPVDVRMAHSGLGQGGLVTPAADGSFETSFTAGPQGQYGAVSVHVPDSVFLIGSQADLGTLYTRTPSTISAFDVRPEPLTYGDPLIADGKVSTPPNGYNLTAAPVVLEFSADGKTGWKAVSNVRPAYTGEFYLNVTPMRKSGYWRARYAGSAVIDPSIGWTDYVAVKYRTALYYFNASPEPVKKGKTITVKGQLFRFMDKMVPGPGAAVYVYFKPKGSTKWTRMAVTKTDRNGWFRKSFTASKDGTWMATYKGSATYIKSDTPSDYVDVR